MEDDAEEHLSFCCEALLRHQSTTNSSPRGQTSTRHRRFENRSTQTLNSASAGDMAPLQGSKSSAPSDCGDMEDRTVYRAVCGTRGFTSLVTATGAPDQPRALFHGNAGFRAHFPALFEPVPAGTQNSEESGVEDRRPEDKDEQHEAGISVEIQIGHKLREMGDRFQYEHLQLFSQHHRAQQGLVQLVTSLYYFLFPPEQAQNTEAQR